MGVFGSELFGDGFDEAGVEVAFEPAMVPVEEFEEIEEELEALEDGRGGSWLRAFLAAAIGLVLLILLVVAVDEVEVDESEEGGMAFWDLERGGISRRETSSGVI